MEALRETSRRGPAGIRMCQGWFRLGPVLHGEGTDEGLLWVTLEACAL